MTMTMPEPAPIGVVRRASLPANVQRWLDKALPSDFPLPSSIRIEQAGMIDVRGGWAPFQARGVYQASPLSFTWRARIQMARGIWIAAEDGHRDGRGWGSARLWGIIPMGKRTGAEVRISQLVRNLGELPWLPSCALADPSLVWSDAGAAAFEVRSRAGDRDVMVHYDLDDQDDVLRAYCPARPYDVPGGYAEAPWYYEFSDYRDFGGVRSPAAAVARFEKSTGAWEYFRCSVTSVAFGAAFTARPA